LLMPRCSPSCHCLSSDSHASVYGLWPRWRVE
jgi:hypothetical protein